METDGNRPKCAFDANGRIALRVVMMVVGPVVSSVCVTCDRPFHFALRTVSI